MTNKDYSLKFYKGQMTNDNGENYNFYLAARTKQDAKRYIEKHVNQHSIKYHLIPGENDIRDISVIEVPVEKYGVKDYEVIN